LPAALIYPALLVNGALSMPDRPAGPGASSLHSTDPSSFNHRVYGTVRGIPLGMVTTYGIIAQAMGDPRKAREVGWALYAKPKSDTAPAHRVVNREGRLSGGWAFGSPEVQRGLLEAEGVGFLADDRVDLERHLWRPEECVVDERSVEPSLFDLLEEEMR